MSAAEGRVVVVTGASGGIGEATAIALTSRGDSVVLVARRADALDAVVSRCGGRATAIVADVTGRAAVQHVVREAIRVHGHIDVWVNNVGRGITRDPSALTDADIDDMMRVNVKTALYGMQEVLPHFRDRGRGHVINVSSMLGRISMRVHRSAYSASKHFLNALTISMRDEVQRTHPDIQFSLVSPPVVRTDFGVNAVHGGPDSRALPDSQSAEEVAGVILRVIDERLPDVYTAPGSAGEVAAYYAALGVDG